MNNRLKSIQISINSPVWVKRIKSSFTKHAFYLAYYLKQIIVSLLYSKYLVIPCFHASTCLLLCHYLFWLSCSSSFFFVQIYNIEMCSILFTLMNEKDTHMLESYLGLCLDFNSVCNIILRSIDSNWYTHIVTI